MKIFWSWQADTPGKTGRHLVRAALAEAIAALKQPEDIEEPAAGEAREALHLDHDRQGVSGSPDLAATIFSKIDAAAVFVADVTLVAQMNEADPKPENPKPAKKLINSNVAIEYGYAVRGLGEEAILMVQNTHYGEREELPFDLKHKAGPIQFRLAPDATRERIATERAKLRGIFVDALRPYLTRGPMAAAQAPFEEVPTTTTSAFFWQPAEVIARIGSNLPTPLRQPSEEDDAIEYRFDEPRAFYLRLIPTVPLAAPLSVTTLMQVVERRQLRVLSRTWVGGIPRRNRFGAIIFEPHGTAARPAAFTQLFRNGEIWGVTGELMAPYYDKLVVPMVSVKNLLTSALANYISTAADELGIPAPYEIEMGAIGLNDVNLSLPLPNPYNQVSEPIYEKVFNVRRMVNDTSEANQRALIDKFIAGLYDLAGIKT